jgi:hypothetical protein
MAKTGATNAVTALQTQLIVDKLCAQFTGVHAPDVVAAVVRDSYRMLAPHLHVTLLDQVERWSRQRLEARASGGRIHEASLTQILGQPAAAS